MFFPKKVLLIVILILFIFGCAKNEISDDKTEVADSLPEIDYIEAKLLLDNNNFEEAKTAFNNIDRKYPLSNWAIRSKLMIIFIHYSQLEYDEAAVKVERFISKYPDYKDIDYAYYIRALIAYEQIKNPALDTSFTQKSLGYFEELIRRFPDSKYAKDGRQKIILINTVLAGKDMHIAMYYLNKKKYLASLNRYKKVISNYETNRYTPEALYRIVEIYYILGMNDDAKKVAAVLGHNYPENIWYKRSYKIVGDTETVIYEDLNWAKKLLKKVF